MRQFVEKIRINLKEDLNFFEYNITTLINEDRARLLFYSLDEKVMSFDEEMKKLIRGYLDSEEIKYTEHMSKNVYVIEVKDVKKSLDGMFSEMDIDLKARDNAIDAQKNIMNKVVNWLNKFTNNVLGLFKQSIETPVELAVDLSDESPFKNLTPEQLQDMKTISEVWKRLPKFMYFEKELLVFEEEMKNIKTAIMNARKQQLKDIFTRILNEIKNMKGSAKEVKVELNKITAEIKKYITNFELDVEASRFDNITSIAKLEEVINQTITELE